MEREIQQQELPYWMGEANHQSRMATLASALAILKADSDTRRFLASVARHTERGGSWSASYLELIGERPAPGRVDPIHDVLGCCESKVKALVSRLRSAGILQRFDRGVGPTPTNRHGIDWDGASQFVRQSLGVGVQDVDPGVQDVDPGVQDVDPGVQDVDPRTNALSRVRTRTPDSDSNQRIKSGTGTGPGSGPDYVRLENVDGIGELRLLSVAALPGGAVKAGKPWEGIAESNLAKPLLLIEWARRQLSLPYPVIAADGEGVLLALAAAVYATRLTPGEIRTGRRNAWFSAVNGTRWSLIGQGAIECAARTLRGLLEQFPELLLSQTWPPTQNTAAVVETSHAR